MARKALDELGHLQVAIIEALWRLGEGTVQQVIATMGRRKKPAYTTILSAMQKLEKAGWLKHRTEGRTYVYRPVLSRNEEGRRSLRKFLRQVFAGDRLALFQHLLDDGALGDAELAAFQKLIDQRRKESGNA
jgi:BlaI family penicillinase repressor